MSDVLYYEDLTVGQQFYSAGSYTIDKESAIAFAREFDPQLQHTDEESAKNTMLGELVVSGWHTAAASMRLKTQTPLFNVAGGLVGLGIESMRWPRPTKPGDTLRVVITILEKRLSNSRPNKGIVKYKLETFNKQSELMMEMITAVWVPRKLAA